MQIRHSFRTLVLASLLGCSVMVLPAMHTFAEMPQHGAGGVDTRPDNATCVLVTQGFYDCTTPDGGEWYCTNDWDPTACVNVVPPPSPTNSGPSRIRPIDWGNIAVGGVNSGDSGAGGRAPILPVKVNPATP